MIERLLVMSEPWLRYAIRINLLGERREDLAGLKNEALGDARIQAYLKDISDYHGVLVTNHKNPDLPIHKLLFLLDLGFGAEVPEIGDAVGQILEHKDPCGVYQSLTNIPAHFGGEGKDVFGWCLCDAPLLLLVLLKAGVDYERHIRQGVAYLFSLGTAQGFPCSVSQAHGSFRGPGRKDDCCPYATLIMLNLLSEIEEYRDSDAARNSIGVILSLWADSLNRHPYMFYMGTDFRKLKAPAIWYDIVSVADCLSKFECAKSDARFLEMVDIIRMKQDENGMVVPESVYLKCKGWDFGQKKAVSPYLSYLCARILGRVSPG